MTSDTCNNNQEPEHTNNPDVWTDITDAAFDLNPTVEVASRRQFRIRLPCRPIPAATAVTMTTLVVAAVALRLDGAWYVYLSVLISQVAALLSINNHVQKTREPPGT